MKDFEIEYTTVAGVFGKLEVKAKDKENAIREIWSTLGTSIYIKSITEV